MNLLKNSKSDRLKGGYYPWEHPVQSFQFKDEKAEVQGN